MQPRPLETTFPRLGAHLDLLRLLVLREIRTRYARTLLGAAWAIVPPLVSAALFSALDFGRLFVPGSQWASVPYAAFAFAGMLFWTHFAQSLTSGTASVALARDMLHKSKFPAELIPLSKVLAWLMDLGIGFVVLVVLMAVAGLPVPWTAALVPLVFLLQLGFTTGLVLLLSAVNLFFRDVQFILQFAVMVLMFASNVVVPVEGASGTFGRVLAMNPVVSYLDAYRTLLFLGRCPDAASLLPGFVGAVVALLAGVVYFRRVSPRFAEEA